MKILFQISPRTRAWKPRVSDERNDDEVLQLQKPPTTPGRTRFSEVEIRDLSSDGSETTSKRSKKKKKRKKRTSRNFSDSDDI